jgi:hypothetical protein
VTPKTPWGEPDLPGVWSSDDTAGIRRERPAELDTRLYQLAAEPLTHRTAMRWPRRPW